MPPRIKTEDVAPAGPAPALSRELCEICEPTELHPSTTSFVCEHGSWTFTPAAEDAPPAPSPEEVRAELLASLDEATLTKLLEAKKAAAAPPAK